jgi:hypothetical protein
MSKPVRRPVKLIRAEQIERDRARAVVELCREALAAGGTLVLNPEDPLDVQTTFTADVEYLLKILEGFVEHGTFHFDPDGRIFHFLQALEVREALSHSASSRTKDQVAAVMQRSAVNERTAYKLIKKFKP